MFKFVLIRLWGFAEGEEKSMIFIYAIVVINWIEAGIGFQNLDHCATSAVGIRFDCCWVESSPSLDGDGMMN